MTCINAKVTPTELVEPIMWGDRQTQTQTHTHTHTHTRTHTYTHMHTDFPDKRFNKPSMCQPAAAMLLA